MSYFPDLSPYAYGSEAHPGVVHVGWLDGIHEFSKGIVPTALISYLRELTTEPVKLYRGFHVCEICVPPKGVSSDDYWKWTKDRRSNGEIRVARGKTVYAAPVLITHYIKEHGYLPPPEFLEAVEEKRRASLG